MENQREAQEASAPPLPAAQQPRAGGSSSRMSMADVTRSLVAAKRAAQRRVPIINKASTRSGPELLERRRMYNEEATGVVRSTVPTTPSSRGGIDTSPRFQSRRVARGSAGSAGLPGATPSSANGGSGGGSRLDSSSNATEFRGLPALDGLKLAYEYQRWKRGQKLMIWLFRTTVLFITTLMLFTVSSYYEQNSSLMDLLLDEEFPDASFKKNFWDVFTPGEFWDWMEGPLLAGIYQTQWYNGDGYSVNETGYVSGVLQLVGGIQLRQARVRDNSCEERRYAQGEFRG
eukprot:g2987.t1